MREEKGKRLLAVYILEILRKYSDAEHPMSQRRILEILEKECGLSAERKAVHNNLDALAAAGFPVRCSETERVTLGRKSVVRLGWYVEPPLPEADSRLLQSLLVSSRLPPQRLRQLSEKLAGLAGPFAAVSKVERNLPDAEWLALLKRQGPKRELAARAITEKKKFSFYYDHYEPDGKWHHDRSRDGTDRRYKVNPYALVAAAGHYFLIANPDGAETVEVYQLLRIAEPEIEEAAQRPMKSVAALENGLAPAQFLETHAKTFCAVPELCTLDVTEGALTELVLDFGKKVFIRAVSGQWIHVEVEAGLSVMAGWALAQGAGVRVTGPPLLVRAVKSQAAALYNLYGGS